MNIVQPSIENIEIAANIIKSGGLVGMPTETVYGLGANAFDSAAVAKIYTAKNRPNFNPLISHVSNTDMVCDIARVDERFYALANKFWPGPLTFVLPRINEKLDLACAGLNSVSVRMPNHPVALALISAAGVPIVAPSANISTTISPTTATHVFDSLGDRVDIILDGGNCDVGLESTILDLTGDDIYLLRPGGLAVEEIEDFLGYKIKIAKTNSSAPKSPGQMLKHYAPAKDLRINVTQKNEDEFFIGFGDMVCDLNLSEMGDLSQAATNLFAYMRIGDADKRYKKIAIAPIPNVGLGLAINDRLARGVRK